MVCYRAARAQREALVATALQSLFQLRRHVSRLHAFGFDHALDEQSSLRRAQRAGLLLARTTDGIERTFAANYLGHFLLVRELLPALVSGEVAAHGRRPG